MNMLLLIAILTTFTWNAPTTNADGTPLTDLAGYQIGYGRSSRDYSTFVPLGKVTTATIDVQSAGRIFAAVQAIDTSGNKSEWSNEVSALVAASSLTVGTVNTVAGAAVDIPVTLSSGEDISAVQFDLIMPAGVTFVSAATSVMDKSVTALATGQSLRVLLFGLNQTKIPSGGIVSLRLQLASSMGAGTVPLPIANVVLSSPEGTAIEGSGSAGALVIAAPTPVPTPTATPQPTATKTPTPRPTATPINPLCTTVEECRKAIAAYLRTIAIKDAELEFVDKKYKAQVELTSKYLKERNDCRAGH